MLSSVSFPASLSAGNFAGNTIAPPQCRFGSKLVVSFASATATSTAEARSTWTEQPRPSYLNSSRGTFYEILGISAGASVQEIKAAYRRLARVCHPDVATKNSSADDFMKIHAAYSTLSDPDKRANYDRSLFRRNRPLTMSGYTTRKWEGERRKEERATTLWNEREEPKITSERRKEKKQKQTQREKNQKVTSQRRREETKTIIV